MLNGCGLVWADTVLGGDMVSASEWKSGGMDQVNRAEVLKHARCCTQCDILVGASPK